jgi:heat shock protein HtpX
MFQAIKNQVKTLVFLSALTGLLLLLGNAFFGRSGLIIALILSLAINFSSYWFSDKIVLSMYRAKQISEADNPRLFKLINEVVMLAGLPMPKIYIIPNNNPNAFATGRNPKNAAVAFTTGILQILDDEELKGVIAHELSHVKNRDILISTIAATIAGVISYLANMLQWAFIFGSEEDNNPFAAILTIILAPIIAMIINFAISRSREYLADATGAKILKNPHGLARALAKLEHHSKLAPMNAPEGGASLFIVNPFSGRSLLKLFSTHPSTTERIRRLKEMRF